MNSAPIQPSDEHGTAAQAAAIRESVGEITKQLIRYQEEKAKADQQFDARLDAVTAQMDGLLAMGERLQGELAILRQQAMELLRENSSGGQVA